MVKNIRKIYLFNFFMMFMLTIPVIVPYWQELGLDIKEIYELQAIYGLCLILFDLPLGYAADRFGRKLSLIFAGIFNILAFQILYRGKTFEHFVYFEVAAAMAYAFYAGSDVALLFESGDSEKGNLLGKRVFYGQMGETISALLCSVLAVISLRLPAEVNLYTSAIPFLVALSLEEPPSEKFSSSHLMNMKEIIQTLFGSSSRLSLLIVFNVTYGLATYVAVWTYQENWKELGIDVGFFGILWALSNLITAYFARKALRIRKLIDDHFLLLFISVVPVCGFTLMAIFRTPLGLVLMILFSLARALNSVLVQQEINDVIPSKMRATANSISSLGMRGGFLLIGPVLGSMVVRKGLPTAFLYLGNLFIVPFLLVTIPLLVLSRSNSGEGYSSGCE